MIEFLFLIIAFFMIGYLAFRLFRKTATILFSISIAIGIFLLIFGFFAIHDAMKFKDGFSQGKNIFVLEQNEEYFAPLVIDFNNSEKGIIETEDLSETIDDIVRGEENEEYYKLFIIRKELLEEVEEFEIDTGIAIIQKDDVIEALFSDHPRKILSSAMEANSEMPGEIISAQVNSIFRTSKSAQEFLFATSLIEIFGDDPLLVIEGVKEGNIIIIPDSLMFKIVRVIPTSVFESAAGLLGENNGNDG